MVGDGRVHLELLLAAASYDDIFCNNVGYECELNRLLGVNVVLALLTLFPMFRLLELFLFECDCVRVVICLWFACKLFASCWNDGCGVCDLYCPVGVNISLIVGYGMTDAARGGATSDTIFEYDDNISCLFSGVEKYRYNDGMNFFSWFIGGNGVNFFSWFIDGNGVNVANGNSDNMVSRSCKSLAAFWLSLLLLLLLLLLLHLLL